jgi:hypothetical protein
MSKFLSIVENMYNDLTDDDKIAIMATSWKKVKDNPASASGEDRQLAKKYEDLKRAKTQLANAPKPLSDVKEADGDDDVVDQTQDTDSEEPIADTLSPEGEVFYVDLIKKALFVDLDNIELSAQEKDIVTHDVTPENAKEVAETLRKIISDFGLGA